MTESTHTQYMRLWRAKNREHLLAWRRENYYKNHDHIRARQKQLREEKKDELNSKRRSDRRESPEKYRKYDNKRWETDKEHIKEKNRKSALKHREKILAHKRQYDVEHRVQTRLWRKLNLDHLVDYNRMKRGGAKPYQFARKGCCEFCGMTNEQSQVRYRRRLDVHHIDEDLKNNSPQNLMTLCRSHHATYKRSYLRMLEERAIPVIE